MSIKLVQTSSEGKGAATYVSLPHNVGEPSARNLGVIYDFFGSTVNVPVEQHRVYTADKFKELFCKTSKLISENPTEAELTKAHTGIKIISINGKAVESQEDIQIDVDQAPRIHVITVVAVFPPQSSSISSALALHSFMDFTNRVLPFRSK